MAAATASLHSLHRADGSATYGSPHKTHTIVAGVNYPAEVPYRSDEIPSSTYIQVNVRPHNRASMVKERHMEEVLRQALGSIVLGEQTPRTMLQVTLQVADVEVDESLPGGVRGGGQGDSYLDLLVGCFNAAVLGCMDAGVQMRYLAGAVVVGVHRDRRTVVSPNVLQRKRCKSLHAFGFSSRGECLLMESEGSFQLDVWATTEQSARQAILVQPKGGKGETDLDADVDMDRTNNLPLLEVMRTSLESRIARDERWRDS